MTDLPTPTRTQKAAKLFLELWVYAYGGAVFGCGLIGGAWLLATIMEM